MPVLFEEKRIFFSSAENETPEIAVVARNCSIVYCFEGRPEGAARPGAAARAKARPTRGKRRKNVMDRSSSRNLLGAELAQVMVQVLVHHHAPLLALEPAEKRVRVGRGLLRAGLAEDVDEAAEPISFGLEVLLVDHDERRIRGRVLAEGFLSEQRRLDEGPENLPDEFLLARLVSRGHLHGDRAVRQHLRGAHLSPVTRGPGLEQREPLENGIAVGEIKKAVHGESL